MKVDFLTRFKGRTSTMNKREGVIGIIKSNGTPIEKMPASYTFSSYISNQNAYNYSDIEKHSQPSNDVTPTSKDPQVITNIKTFNKSRKLSHASPLKPGTNMSNMYRSQFVPDKEMYQFPLSKTGSVNLNDYELIAIPKSVLQFGTLNYSEFLHPSNLYFISSPKSIVLEQKIQMGTNQNQLSCQISQDNTILSPNPLIYNKIDQWSNQKYQTKVPMPNKKKKEVFSQLD